VIPRESVETGSGSFSAGLLLDAAKVDFPDERFCDNVKRVNLLLHQNIGNLERMIGD